MRIATTAALLGDPARANMLAALMDGRALTAKELAYAAHVSPQTTSGHLGKLTEAGLLTPHKQGRHRYYRLASPLVGQMLEGIMAVAGELDAAMPERRSTWRGGEALRTARSCYDHLAGPAGRRAGGFAVRARARCADRGRRRGHRHRPPLPARVRRGTRARPARVLPPLPGLERAAPAHRRPARRGAGLPVLRARLDRAAARHARGGDHRSGPRGVRGTIRGALGMGAKGANLRLVPLQRGESRRRLSRRRGDACMTRRSTGIHLALDAAVTCRLRSTLTLAG